MIEFIYDKNERKWNVIEMNGRPWLMIDFFRRLDLSFLKLLTQDFQNFNLKKIVKKFNLKKKKILVIIGARGIGDLIYHLPLLRSLHLTHRRKLIILSNKKGKKFSRSVVDSISIGLGFFSEIFFFEAPQLINANIKKK